MGKFSHLLWQWKSSLSYLTLISSLGNVGLCHCFLLLFFSLYRLTQTYVNVFIPALPVSFQGLRGSILGVHGYKVAVVSASPIHWDMHMVLAPHGSMVLIMDKTSVCLLKKHQGQARLFQEDTVLNSFNWRTLQNHPGRRVQIFFFLGVKSYPSQIPEGITLAFRLFCAG
jgi:hypothetical protein